MMQLATIVAGVAIYQREESSILNRWEVYLTFWIYLQLS